MLKINKEEALALVKVLHPVVENNSRASGSSTHQDTLGELADRLDEYLLSSDEESDVSEDEDQSDYSSDEDDTDEDEEDSEVDGPVSSQELFDLSPVKTDRGYVSFDADAPEGEYYSDAGVELVRVREGDSSREGPVELVQRNGTDLFVRVNNNWHHFSVKKFPKGWAASLPLGQTLEVSD